MMHLGVFESVVWFGVVRCGVVWWRCGEQQTFATFSLQQAVRNRRVMLSNKYKNSIMK